MNESLDDRLDSQLHRRGMKTLQRLFVGRKSSDSFAVPAAVSSVLENPIHDVLLATLAGLGHKRTDIVRFPHLPRIRRELRGKFLSGQHDHNEQRHKRCGQ